MLDDGKQFNFQGRTKRISVEAKEIVGCEENQVEKVSNRSMQERISQKIFLRSNISSYARSRMKISFGFFGYSQEKKLDTPVY